jgi:hypothetical protein
VFLVNIEGKNVRYLVSNSEEISYLADLVSQLPIEFSSVEDIVLHIRPADSSRQSKVEDPEYEQRQEAHDREIITNVLENIVISSYDPHSTSSDPLGPTDVVIIFDFHAQLSREQQIAMIQGIKIVKEGVKYFENQSTTATVQYRVGDKDILAQIYPGKCFNE